MTTTYHTLSTLIHNTTSDVDSNRDRDQEEELVNRALDMRAEEVTQGPGAGDTVEVLGSTCLSISCMLCSLHWCR